MIELLNQYQRAALRTAGEAYTKLDDLALLGGALMVAGEAGEVADLVKKHFMQGHGWDAERMKLELGDVLWGIAVLAQRCGFTLQDVAQANVDKLVKRYPEKFEVERSVNRDG